MSNTLAQQISNALGAQNLKIKELTARLEQVALASAKRRMTPQEEIDQIPGRRTETRIQGSVLFTATDAGKRGQPVTIQLSQDGPFIQTHYPLVGWKPVSPGGATYLNRWRPVSSLHLDTQAVGQPAGVELLDSIDISYEIEDGGSQRRFQNQASMPLFSRMDNLMALPVPVLWGANSPIIFTPTYESISFTSAVPPDQGELHVMFIGYRINNL